MAAWPRGSRTSSCRTASISAEDCAAARRSRTLAPGTTSTPAVTMRNGSPAVW
nr:hypothetical protein [Amycolatopsis acidiphila]